MNNNLKKVSLKFNCTEDWNSMKPVNGGRHCDVCNKKVIDFSKANKQAFNNAMQETNGNLCGRFHIGQTDIVNRFKFDKAAAVLLATSGLVFAVQPVYSQGAPIYRPRVDSVTNNPLLNKPSGLTPQAHVPNRSPLPYSALGEPAVMSYPLAKYPGDSLQAFLMHTIQWPKDLREDYFVELQITVDSVGKVTQVDIVRTNVPENNAEFIRAAKLAVFLPPKDYFNKPSYGSVIIRLGRKE